MSAVYHYNVILPTLFPFPSGDYANALFHYEKGVSGSSEVMYKLNYSLYSMHICTHIHVQCTCICTVYMYIHVRTYNVQCIYIILYLHVIDIA